MTSTVIKESNGITLVESVRTVRMVGTKLSYKDHSYSVHGTVDGIPCTSGPLGTLSYGEHVFKLWTDPAYSKRIGALVDTSKAINGSVRCSLAEL